MTTALQLAEVRAKGRRFRGRTLEIRALDPDLQPSRVGIIVPRHSHSATERNLVKRRLREIVRRDCLTEPNGATFVVYALPTAYAASFEALRGELHTLCVRANRPGTA